MKPKRTAPKDHIEYHKDGSVWARGQTIDGVPTGYWEWFRKGGTRMRSGHFEVGEQVGEWTTYDQSGAVYKVTRMRAQGSRGAGNQGTGNESKNKGKSNKGKGNIHKRK